MSKGIPLSKLSDEWFKDPEFVREYDALEEEFALATALIKARADAGLTQEELAQRMGTTQSAIARAEEGNGSNRGAFLYDDMSLAGSGWAKATGTGGCGVSFERVGV